MIVFALIVGWVALVVVSLALVGGARHTSDPIPPILRVTTRSDLDGGPR